MAGESARAIALQKRDKAERLLRAAVALERGAAKGDDASVQALGALPALEWRVFHGVRWPGRRFATIDHVLVGPQGVFVVATKAWTGYVEARSGLLRQNGHRRNRAVTSAEDAALAVSGLLPGFDPEMLKPVICLVRPEPVFGWVNELMLCSTANIVTLLPSRPKVLSKEEAATVAEQLAQSFRAANPLVPRVAAKVHRQRRRTRSRKAGLFQTILAATSVVALVLIFLWLGGPQRVADLSTRTVQGLDASIEPLGEHFVLMGGPSRPPLDVSMSHLGVTESRTPGIDAARGEVLMAVQMTIRNQGERTWVSQPGLKVVLRDDTGKTHRTVPAFTTVEAGRVLPSEIRLAPGKSTRGFVIFEVPRRTSISQVKLTVGPDNPKTLRWSVNDR